MLTEREQEAIDNIMDYFDFDKVLKTMIALDWKWVKEDHKSIDDLEIPSIERIRKTARKALMRAIEIKDYTSGGGFEAEYDDGNLYLRFVVEEWDERATDE